jgi:hypothetical protein
MSFARRRIAGDVITRLRSSAPSGGAGAAGVGSGFVSGCASSTAGGATGADSAAAAASVSKTTSGAPTAMMSPGSPASLTTLPETGDDNSTAALSVIIVPTKSSSLT